MKKMFWMISALAMVVAGQLASAQASDCKIVRTNFIYITGPDGLPVQIYPTYADAQKDLKRMVQDGSCTASLQTPECDLQLNGGYVFVRINDSQGPMYQKLADAAAERDLLVQQGTCVRQAQPPTCYLKPYNGIQILMQGNSEAGRGFADDAEAHAYIKELIDAGACSP